MSPSIDLSGVTSSFAEKQLGQFYSAVEESGQEMFRRQLTKNTYFFTDNLEGKQHYIPIPPSTRYRRAIWSLRTSVFSCKWAGSQMVGTITNKVVIKIYKYFHTS